MTSSNTSCYKDLWNNWTSKLGYSSSSATKDSEGKKILKNSSGIANFAVPNCCIYLCKQGAWRIPRRIGVSQAYGVGKTICHCDFVCTCVYASMWLQAPVCVHACSWECWLNNLSVFWQPCHTPWISLGGSCDENSWLPLYAWILYLTPATMNCTTGDLLCGRKLF